MIAIPLADFCHKELKDWRSELELFETQMKGFKKRLIEVTEQNSSEEIMKEVDHFENHFIIQKKNFDILNHEIKLHEKDIVRELQENPIFDNINITDRQFSLRAEIHTAEKLFLSTKNEFYDFLGRVL